MRIGPKMKKVIAYVMTHPGCTKKAAAAEVAPNGSVGFGYRTVNRTIATGLIRAEKQHDGSYKLY